MKAATCVNKLLKISLESVRLFLRHGKMMLSRYLEAFSNLGQEFQEMKEANGRKFTD